MELYASENNFNIFYEKKRRELKNLQDLNNFVKPNPYFVYFMFKDTIHVDDYGSIKETLFKFPSMTRVSNQLNHPMCSFSNFAFFLISRAPKTKCHASTCSVTTSTPRSVFATMSMKTSGPSRSLVTAARASFTSARPPSLSLQTRFWLLVADLLPRKTRAYTSLSRMRSPTRAPWMRAEMHMPLQCAEAMSTY